MRKPLLFFVISFFVIFLSTTSLLGQTGIIKGKVTDAATGDPLPGANLVFKEFNIGAASNYDGKFIITAVPVGKHKLTVSYISYKTKEIEVNIEKDRVLELNIQLEHQSIVGETVVVTAQASAQVEAMSEQINSNTIKNVVSAKTIQSLPESNAAEAVGRISGVSLLRSGGEGNKVVIRGMAPKYSKIQIEGVDMASTGSGDRSTDLSMISPYMLDGIEVSKSIMADQEADATGGIVNFRLKEAPEKTHFNAILEGGYNGLTNTYDNYKISVGGSSRLFDKKFGIYAQLIMEQKNTSADQMGNIWFHKEEEDRPVETRAMQLIDVNRLLKRYGATLVLDYSLPTTKIKLSSFNSKINKDQQTWNINYALSSNDFGRNLTDEENELFVTNNALKFEQYFDHFLIEGGASFALSENKTPNQWEAFITLAQGSSPWDETVTHTENLYNLDPYEIPNLVTKVPVMLFTNMNHSEFYTRESEYAFDLSGTYSNTFSKSLDVKVKIGGRIKHKTKSYDAYIVTNMLGTGGPDAMAFRDMVIRAYYDQLSEYNRSLLGRSAAGGLRYDDFIDQNYVVNGFLGGRYRLDRMPNLEMFRKIDEMAVNQGVYYLDRPGSTLDDYWGYEDYYAFYIKPEIKLFERLTIVPGLRYEKNRTHYTGISGDISSMGRVYEHFPQDTLTHIRNNEYWLPMIQAFWKPYDWLNIKGGYVKTLQRPNYWDLVPSYKITRKKISWRNYALRPEQAQNWDFQVSVYDDKVGLFSVGYFYKKIKDMIFWTGDRAIVNPADYGLPDRTKFKLIAYSVNNEYDVTNHGIEFEWRSNFWWLPGLLKGLVININYTRNFSDAKYLQPRIIQEYDPNTFTLTLKNNDTTYAAPMLLQPDHLLNFTIGYDYKGFSIRYALRYKSHVFSRTDWWEELRGYSTDFIRHDLSIKQELPYEGLELFLNIYNLSNEYERDVINYRGFTSNEEHYGRIGYLGIRYTF